MALPFDEEKCDNGDFIRTFYDKTPDDEFCWHRDHTNRVIKVLNNDGGWKFQYDNELPFPLIEGLVFDVKKDKWHRVIKGTGLLVLKITNT